MSAPVVVPLFDHDPAVIAAMQTFRSSADGHHESKGDDVDRERFITQRPRAAKKTTLSQGLRAKGAPSQGMITRLRARLQSAHDESASSEPHGAKGGVRVHLGGGCMHTPDRIGKRR